MSYINEALRRAQREKDLENPHSQRILSKTKGKPGIFYGRKVIVALSFLVLFVFIFYSWSYMRGKKTSLVPKKNKSLKTPSLGVFVRAEDFYDKARYFHKANRFEDARIYYEKALVLDPRHVFSLNNIGVLDIQEKDYSAGQKSLESALKIKPEYVDPYYNLACLYAIKGNKVKALSYLKRAFVLDKSVEKWAQDDKDLENLRDMEGFKEIIGSGEDGNLYNVEMKQNIE